MVIAFLTVRFMPRDWHMLERPVSWPSIVCGQQSLEVFCVGRLSVVRNLFCARRSIERDLDAGAGESRGRCADDRRCRLPVLVKEGREDEGQPRTDTRLNASV